MTGCAESKRGWQFVCAALSALCLVALACRPLRAQEPAGASALWSARPYAAIVVVFHDAAPCWTESAVQAVIDHILAADRSLWGEAVRLQVIQAPRQVHDWIEGPIAFEHVAKVVSLMSNSPTAGMPGLLAQNNRPSEYDKIVLLALSKRTSGWAAYAREYDTTLGATGPLVQRLGGAAGDLQPALAALAAALCPVVEVRRTVQGRFRYRPRCADLDWGGLGQAPLSQPCVLRVHLEPAVPQNETNAWQDEVFLHYDPATDATQVYARQRDPLAQLEADRRFYASVVHSAGQATHVRLAHGASAAAGWELAVRPLEGGTTVLLDPQPDGSFRTPIGREPIQWLELRAHGRSLAHWPLLTGGEPEIELDASRFLPLAQVAALADALSPLVAAAALEYEQSLAELRAAQSDGGPESVAALVPQTAAWRAEREQHLLARLQSVTERWPDSQDPVTLAARERLAALSAEVQQSLDAQRLAEFAPRPEVGAASADPSVGAPPPAGAVPPVEGAAPPAGVPTSPSQPPGAPPAGAPAPPAPTPP